LIEISSLPLSKLKITFPSEAKSKIPLALLRNEIIKGKVIKTLTSQTALLLIKGRTVLAQSNAPLKEGTVVSLKVVDTDPMPTLKLHPTPLAKPAGANMGLIFSALEENIWKSVMEKVVEPGFPKTEGTHIKEVLTELSRDLLFKPKPDFLSALIDKLGLRWEAKLRHLLISKQVESGSIENLIKGDLKGLGARSIVLRQEEEGFLNRFVTTLDNIQLLNRLGLDQKQKIFLPVPMHFQDGLFTVGQLLIQLPQKESHKEENQRTEKAFFKVTFLLQMSILGPLRADLTLSGKTINARIWLTKEDAKVLVEKNLPSLIDSLRQHGFLIHRIECQLRDKEQVRQSLIKEMILEEGQTISLRA